MLLFYPKGDKLEHQTVPIIFTDDKPSFSDYNWRQYLQNLHYDSYNEYEYKIMEA